MKAIHFYFVELCHSVRDELTFLVSGKRVLARYGRPAPLITSMSCAAVHRPFLPAVKQLDSSDLYFRQLALLAS